MLYSSSVVLVVCSAKPGTFGTGFVIHRDESATYVLTCKHVLDPIKSLRIDNQPAVEVASDDAKYGFDLAVLKVEGDLNRSPLSLNPIAKPGRSFAAAGFSNQADSHILEQFRGTLGKPVGRESQRFGDCGGWQLDMGADGRFENGYSGSPVIDEASGRAVGVVAVRRDDPSGKKGIAIAVSALLKMWPDMPAPLRDSLTQSRAGEAGSREPVMNLKAEVATFKAALTGSDSPKCPPIVIDGGSGMGKSYLLQLYRQIAESEDFDSEHFGLAAQISVPSCLEAIVKRFGAYNFPRYEQYLDTSPQISDPNGSIAWQGALTRQFFKDLAEHDYMAKLVVFFDQYEKADPVFKEWLGRTFLPSISPQGPLIAIVAGQGADPLRTGCQFFRLDGLKKEHFQSYAQECKVTIDAQTIETLHGFWNGRPKDFAEYVKFLSRSPQGGS